MNFKGFNYKNNNLFCEHVSLEDISFEFGTQYMFTLEHQLKTLTVN